MVIPSGRFPVLKFKIYYDGGETYDGDPYYAPGTGVLVIAQEDKNHGRRLELFKDYFIWTDWGWVGVNEVGFYDYLQSPGPKKVLFGRFVETEYFYSVVKKANDDQELPERTAWYEYEDTIQRRE